MAKDKKRYKRRGTKVENKGDLPPGLWVRRLEPFLEEHW